MNGRLNTTKSIILQAENRTEHRFLAKKNLLVFVTTVFFFFLWIRLKTFMK